MRGVIDVEACLVCGLMPLQHVQFVVGNVGAVDFLEKSCEATLSMGCVQFSSPALSEFLGYTLCR